MMKGYPKVASLMGTHSEFAILRRFRTLNMQNLLYLQAELVHLEEDLRKIEVEDARNENRQHHHHDWWSLCNGENEGDTDQWNLLLEIRTKLEKYNEALIKFAAVLHLEEPANHDLEFLRKWFERPGMGSFPLWGLDRDSWASDNQRDLTALMARPASDRFSQWFTDGFMPKFHHMIGKRFKQSVSEDLGSGLYEYNETSLQTIARVASTVIASVLPLCSVILLYIITDNRVRLAVIVILSVFFSLGLSLMTNARKIEIFAATSAFAAVNVVYLTNGAPCAA